MLSKILLKIETFFLDRFERPISEYHRLPRWFRLAFQSLVIGGFIGLSILFFGWDSIKRYRATAILNEAVQLKEAGQFQDSFEKARTALRVDPTFNDPVSFIYEMTYPLGIPDSLVWGMENGKRLGYTEDQMLELIEIGIRFERFFDVRPLILHLRERLPDDQRVQIALARLYLHDGEPLKALEIAENFIPKDPENPTLHQLGFDAAISSRSVEFLEKMGPLWFEYINREDELGITALRILTRLDQSNSTLLSKLEVHPLADRGDRVFVANFKIRNRPQDADAILQSIKPEFNLDQVNDRALWTSLLAIHRLYDEIIESIKDPREHRNGRITWEYVSALLELGRAQEAIKLFNESTRRELGLTRAHFDYLRSIADKEQSGEYSTYSLTSVLRNSTPGEWSMIEEDLRKRGQEDALIVFHEHMSRSFDAPETGNAFLLLRAYQTGDEIQLRILLNRENLKSFAQQPGTVAWFAAYLRIILNIRVNELHSEIQDLL
ncbi:MAG: hypothetical protein ACFCU4_07045, partial [Puniceicoccaceae bacterium]